MGLTQTKQLFFKIRSKCSVIVKNHAFKDYPERGFSKNELVQLVRAGNGQFTENDSDVAIENSFLFFPQDVEGRECKLVLLIEVVEIEGEGCSQTESVIICSAYREV